MDWMTDWFFDFLFGLQSSILSIVDFIRDVFFMLAGIQPVQIEGQETEILTHFVMSQAVRTAFLYILLISLILLAVFVMIAIIRSEYVHGGESKKSKSQIMGKALQSFLIFLLVPFILISGIILANVVVGSINLAMNPHADGTLWNATIGGQVLVTSGHNAWIGDPNIRAEIERQFMTGELNFADRDTVSQFYRIRDLDFFIGIAGGLVILIMFIMSAIMFIQRIFDVILLFIISPVSISTIPIDEGNRFRLWREMTASKVLSAYGIILAMNLFFIIIPQISNITFFTNSFHNGLVQILFLIGGAFAITKANLVIAQLTSSSTGTNETQQLIANMKTIKMMSGKAFGLAGLAIGGTKFVTGHKREGFRGSLSSLKSKPSNPVASPDGKQSKIARYGKMPTRVATMPIGMVKDLCTSGVAGMTRNIVPRARNTVCGNTMFNYAQDKKDKEKKT